MTLTTPLSQATLSLTHVQSVLESCDAHLTSALCGVCYYTSDEAGWNARQSWWKVCGVGGGVGVSSLWGHVPYNE